MRHFRYYDSVSTRPLVVVAGIMILVIIVLRNLICGLQGSLNGYDCDNPNNILASMGYGTKDTLVLTGVVNSVQIREYSDGGRVYTVNLKRVMLPNEKGKSITRPWESIQINMEENNRVKIGQTLQVAGKMAHFNKATNWGEFDSYGYYSSKGILFKLDNAKVCTWGEDYSWIRDCLWRFRMELDKCIDEIYGEEDGAILKAMLVGNKNDIPQRVKEAFQKCGISHILAISGLHVSFLCMMVFKGLELLGLNKYICSIISEIFLVLYIVMVGFTPSAIRAAVMFSTYVVAKLLKRSYDLITAASLALIIISGFNPWQLWDSSFQLSFLAIAGIGFLANNFINNSQYINKPLKKRDSKRLCGRLYNVMIAGTLRDFITSSIIFAVTLPVLLYGYYEVALYSVALNMVILPLMPVLLVSSIAGILLTTLVGEIGAVFVVGSKLILALYKHSCIFMEESGFGRYNFGKPYGWSVVVYYLFLLVFCLYSGRHMLKIRLLCVLGCLTLFVQYPDGLYFLDVGQGDCVVAIDNKKAYVMDCGSTSKKNVGNNILIPFLKSKGINVVEAVFVSHPDEDHISGIYELIEKSKTECITINRICVFDESLKANQFEKLVDLARQEDITVLGIDGGDRISGPEITIECLYPSDILAEDMNNNSLVLMCTFDGLRMIECGDVEIEGENVLLKEDVKADIIKIAHHGSSSSSSEGFMQMVNPKLAIISAGKNNRYGHPHMETIELLDTNNIEYLCTMDTGALFVTSDKNRIKVEGFND